MNTVQKFYNEATTKPTTEELQNITEYLEERPEVKHLLDAILDLPADQRAAAVKFLLADIEKRRKQ